jgi:hypothetical protein
MSTAIACVVMLAAGSASARTIVLTDEHCEEIATISSLAPKLGWAGMPLAQGQFGNNQLYLGAHTSFLIRYPLDRIPPGQKITKAEWTVPHTSAYPPNGVRMHVYRLLVPWGAGVSHLDRMTRPARAAWNVPGARGVGQDRAAKSTATALVKGGVGEQTYNVTADVELWYTGAAKNYGWVLAIDDQDTTVVMQSPFWGAPKGWKLRITYEPQ